MDSLLESSLIWLLEFLYLIKPKKFEVESELHEFSYENYTFLELSQGGVREAHGDNINSETDTWRKAVNGKVPR